MRRLKTWLDACKNFAKTDEIKHILQNDSTMYVMVTTILSRFTQEK